MKKFLFSVVAVFVFCINFAYTHPCGGTSQPDSDEKTQLEQVKKALAEFKKEYKAAKDDADKKVKCFDIIRGLSHKLIVDEMARLLKSEKADKVKLEIINTLAMMRLVECIKPLSKALKKEEKNPQVRDMIIQSLGMIAHEKCIAPLEKWLKDHCEILDQSDILNSNTTAISALGNIRDKKVIEKLIALYTKVERIPVPDKETTKKSNHEYLISQFKNTLQMMTGVSEETAPKSAKEWKKWWYKEKKNFKFPGEQ